MIESRSRITLFGMSARARPLLRQTRVNAPRLSKETVMNDSLEDMVRDVVARHLDVEASTLTLEDDVEKDLGLDPLDLVLIALRIEENVSIEFPIARLESVHRLDDLIDIVRSFRVTLPGTDYAGHAWAAV
jgi:acyl carrier protein